FAARTVMLAGRRYIVCRNHQEAEKDAADRASILAALERQLAKGDKALVGNTGYRRYLKTISEDHFAIDPDKVEDDKKFDGIFVLRTNTDLNPLEAMLCYKQLWTVEQTFRTAKHLLSTRPIFHKLDATIRGHVFCSFLALVLKKALEDRIAALARSGSWPQIIADLDSLTETEIEHGGKRFVVRSAPRPAARLALRAASVPLPWPPPADPPIPRCSAKPPSHAIADQLFSKSNCRRWVKREARDVQLVGSITHDGCCKRVCTHAKLHRTGSSSLLAVFLVNAGSDGIAYRSAM